MKVELQISETYEEEKLIVQAPQPTDKVQKVIEFAENLDRKEKIKGKIDDQVYLAKQFYPNFPIRNHQYRLHLSSQAHAQRSGRNLSKK